MKYLTAAILALGLACAVMADEGTPGGVLVHVGCGDGEQTLTMLQQGRFLVHALDRDSENVAQTRARAAAAGVSGRISVETLAGSRLPYVDSLVNTIVATSECGIDRSELMRVLVPGGKLIGPAGPPMLKPLAVETDEWTHYLHGADNNAVAEDTVVGSPRHLQWTGGPRWSRHHEHMSSMSAMVSAGGRVFYIFDEGLPASIQLPPRWKLIARDAFNGCVLWKRDIAQWYTHLYPLKSGPSDLPRRMVTDGKRVYLPLGIDQPLSAVDAATGETIRTYTGTGAAEEVILSDGILYVVSNPASSAPTEFNWKEPICWWANYRATREHGWYGNKRTLMAVNAESGSILWKGEHAVAPLTLAVDGDKVVYCDDNDVICLDKRSGELAWRTASAGVKDPNVGGGDDGLVFGTQFAPTLVIHRGVVLFGGGSGKLEGFDLATGERLWEGRHHKAGHMSPWDLLCIDGVVWTGGLADRQKNNIWTGYNVKTGAIEKEFAPDIKSYWFHARCHKSRATVDFLLPSRTGIEVVDWRKETWERNHWVRGACLYGIMPCNGLIYAPQHPCACYMETKLNGLNALAAPRQMGKRVPEDERRTKGPAYGKAISNQSSVISEEITDEWPTFRADSGRSGFVETDVNAEAKEAWRAEIGGRLSALTSADGRCYVSAIDQNMLVALDADNGKTLWTYTVGASIDSPPTIFRNRVIFGSNDGHVYCLRASDGALAWRYLAAPGRDKHMAFGRIESVWPVHGSVLVTDDGVVSCVAGRSAFVDGGMRLCRLDATTGALISETAIDHRLPGSDQDLQTTMKGLNMPTALPDILSSDGKFMYMRSQQFDMDGKRMDVSASNKANDQLGEGTHLFSGVGFLDGSWFHRAYWLYGKKLLSGCNYWFRAARHAPAGRLMVFDDDTVYGYGRQPHYFLWTPSLEYRLFAVNREVTPAGIERVEAGTEKLNRRDTKGPWYTSDRWIFNRKVTEKLPEKELTATEAKWSSNEPELIARAMVLAGDTLFVAGPPDLLDEEAAVDNHYAEETQRALAAQDAAMRGGKGGILWAVSAKSGERLSRSELDTMPVWDGMAAADGSLLVACVDGTVRCLR